MSARLTDEQVELLRKAMVDDRLGVAKAIERYSLPKQAARLHAQFNGWKGKPPGRPAKLVATPESLRTCHVCKIPKPLTEFYADTAAPLGVGYRCRACHKAYKEARKKDRAPQS